MAVIEDKVKEIFETYRKDKDLQKLILDLCGYVDYGIKSAGNMSIFNDAVRKEFDDKCNII